MWIFFYYIMSQTRIYNCFRLISFLFWYFYFSWAIIFIFHQPMSPPKTGTPPQIDYEKDSGSQNAHAGGVSVKVGKEEEKANRVKETDTSVAVTSTTSTTIAPTTTSTTTKEKAAVAGKSHSSEKTKEEKKEGIPWWWWLILLLLLLLLLLLCCLICCCYCCRRWIFQFINLSNCQFVNQYFCSLCDRNIYFNKSQSNNFFFLWFSFLYIYYFCFNRKRKDDKSEEEDYCKIYFMNFKFVI